jgi:hypothetical protein
MSTVLEKKESACRDASSKPVYLNNSEELRQYLAAHLTPVRTGPKGQPIYRIEDIEALHIVLPDGA